MPEGLYVPIRFGIVYVVGGTGFDCAELLLAVAEVVLKSVVKTYTEDVIVMLSYCVVS